ncbi:AsmA family protein [Halomonas mongoliensis]|uniref:AsmA family protein n=1 Tax=Halomonas mongoliensis TaxID=321265 RepID=UPI00403A8BC6
MKRVLSTLLAAVGILAVLAVAAVVYVTTFFDPEDLKPRLIEVVREQSGLELALEGPLTWSFYPRLGVGVEKADAWLPDQAVSEEASFVAFRRAEVSLAFAPLLRGEVAIDGMTLEGMRLNLERDETGRGNWETLMERLAERSEAAEEVLAPASATTGPVPDVQSGLHVALNIASVQVRDGEVSYRDLGADQELRLENLAVTGSNVNPRNAFPLRASFRLVSYDDLEWQAEEVPPRLASDVTLEGRATLGLAERRYLLDGLSLTTASRLAAVEGEQKLNLQGSQLRLDALERRLHLEEGRLESTLRHPALGGAPLPLSMTFALEADLQEETARLRDLELSGEHGLRLSGNLNVSQLLEAPAYDGQVRLAPFSLRPWLERFDSLPTTADAEALTDVALTSSLQGDLSRLELPGLTLILDGSTFTGRLAAGLDGHALDFDLQGDRLDLDAYLPSTPPADARASTGLPTIARAYAQEPGTLVPAEWLAELALRGELRLGLLGLGGLEFRDVDLALEGGDGRQRLSRFEAGFYEGSLAASGELDLTRDPIRWQLEPRIERVRADELLEALGDEKAPLRGRFSAEGELTSRGNTWPALKRHLDGRVESRIDDGAILDVNVSRELCTAVAALEGRETTRDWHPDTRFDEAGATFVIRDGTLNSDDLLVRIPGIELGGEGWLDLTSERFELLAAARIVDTADAACRVNPRLERLPFPVRCEGSLSGERSEWCRFDRAAFQSAIGEALRDELGSRAGEELERRLEGTLERLDERVGEGAGRELRDALRGLLN